MPPAFVLSHLRPPFPPLASLPRRDDEMIGQKCGRFRIAAPTPTPAPTPARSENPNKLSTPRRSWLALVPFAAAFIIVDILAVRHVFPRLSRAHNERGGPRGWKRGGAAWAFGTTVSLAGRDARPCFILEPGRDAGGRGPGGQETSPCAGAKSRRPIGHLGIPPPPKPSVTGLLQGRPEPRLRGPAGSRRASCWAVP